MRTRMWFLVAFVALLLFRPIAGFAESGIQPDSIKAYVSRALADWHVPGAAIAIVKGDSVLFAQGFGVRTIGTSDPVDTHTLFAIASLSKAFTVASLGMLVEQKKIRWDDKVTDFLPYFQMYDPYVTREMTLRDLVSHRSGLATFGGDLIWYGTKYSRKEVISRIRYLKPKYSFRANYGYQNIMMMTAGEVIPVVTGRSWEAFIQDSILTRLGMDESTTSIRDFHGRKNVATPHMEVGDKVVPVPYRNVDNIAPAAGINSSVHDLARWMSMWLRDEDAQGIHLLNASTRNDIFSPQTPLRVSLRAQRSVPSRHFSAACMGWFTNDYMGKKILSHGGAMDGMISEITLIPEEHIGIIVLTNAVSGLASAVMNKLIDFSLRAPDRDWSGEALKRMVDGRNQEKLAEEGVIKNRRLHAPSSLKLQEYAGTYRSDMYGDVEVMIEKERLVARFVPSETYVADLDHWQFDTFRITMRDPTLPQKGFATFVLDASGVPKELKINIPNPDFDFTELELLRVPPQR